MCGGCSQPVGHAHAHYHECKTVNLCKLCYHYKEYFICNDNGCHTNLPVTESCKVCYYHIAESINPRPNATGAATIIIVPGVQENTKDGGSEEDTTDHATNPIPAGSRAPIITNHGTNPAEETNDGCLCLYMLTAFSYISGSVLTNVIVNTVVAALCGIDCVLNCGRGICYTCEKPKGTFV